MQNCFYLQLIFKLLRMGHCKYNTDFLDNFSKLAKTIGINVISCFVDNVQG